MTERRVLVAYIAIAFGWAWALWVPYAAAQQGADLPPGMVEFFERAHSFGAWGPLIAALAVTYDSGKRGGVMSLLKRGLRFRFGLGWWLTALFLYPAMIGTSMALGVLLGDEMPELTLVDQPLMLPVVFVVILLLYGPLQEEFGWRGIVQDRLQTRWSAVIASLVAGLLWGVWHLPLFYMNRTDPYYQGPIWGLIVSTVLASVLFAWVYNNTRRSILAVMVIHASFNLAHVAMPTIGMERAPAILMALQVVVIAIVIIVWSPRSLSTRH